MNSETGKKWLLAILILGWVGLLVGCTALKRPEELVWQGLHVYDTLQTIEIGKSYCYYESDPVTSRILGQSPEKKEVLAWGVGSALVHAGVSELLLRHDMAKTYRIWQSLTILSTAGTVYNNYSLGVRVGAPNTLQPEDWCGGRAPPMQGGT